MEPQTPNLDPLASFFALSWSPEQLSEAIETLGRSAGFHFNPPLTPLAAPRSADSATLDAWLANATRRLDLEAEPISVDFADVANMLRRAAPALLQLPGKTPRFLLLLGANRQRVKLIAPDLTTHQQPLDDLAQALTAELTAPCLDSVNQLLSTAGVAPERREKAAKAMLKEQLTGAQLQNCWLLRQLPASSFWQQMKHAWIPHKLSLLIAAHALQQGLQILGWWLILRGALSGTIDLIWLSAWALVLLTSIPFQLLVVWLQSLVTVGLGTLLKQRLLFGTLQLRPEEVRHQGIGQFLGRVLEAETLETIMLGGGFSALIALVELGAAGVILGIGAVGFLHVIMLVFWLALTLFISWRYFHSSRRWRRAHRVMINDLIERMVGHRTRLAQQSPEHWHDEEDQTQTAYLQLSRGVDSNSVQLRGVINRGWLLLSLGGLGHALISGEVDPALIAISIGGMMLASRALTTLVVGMDSLVGVFNAWGQVGPLFRAAERGLREPTADQLQEGTNSDQPLLLARDLVYRYRDYGQPVLRGCDLQIKPGDRVLLEGGSGGGKSTLAALITGLRQPTSGLLLLNGLDRRTLGNTRWRQKAVAAPQFHENHVLTETLAFNLLMGRRWPPHPEDLQEAERICQELGLGELLQRMPAGLQQMVGESGWQLSHGERSRLFIARALLQRAELIVLDESFAALDPVNLERALRCVLQRAPALLVIAHP